MSETTNVNTTVATKLTREEKLRARYAVLLARIEKDTEAANDIAAELNGITALAAVGVGSNVTVKLGRKFADKDTTRFVPAIVVGVKEEEDGSKLYKVQYGEGFDAEIATVNAAAISLPSAEPVAAAE